MKKRQQEETNSKGCLYWAIIIAFFIILATGCTASFKTTGITQARLIEVHRITPGNDSLILLNRQGETIHFLNGSVTGKQIRYLISDYYTIRYDTLKSKNDAGKVWIKATIKHSY